jgi:hypothetical protein
MTEKNRALPTGSRCAGPLAPAFKLPRAIQLIFGIGLADQLKVFINIR